MEQNYFRAETLSEANAKLVDFHSQLYLANMWGGGEIASADGLRFIIPVKSVHSVPNPKYFGSGRGVTYYNYTSDQFTGLHGLVIPGTIRDSLYLLQCVLEQNTNLQPKEIMTDTAGYSDIILGLFGLLGYQFSLRLADISESRLWRFDVNSDYRGEARAVFYGKRGELHQPYREGQEDQLGALGLVANTIVVWNTSYIESALQVLQNRGHMINNDDISRLSPLGHKHINIVGRSSFILPGEVKYGQLRTLIYEEDNQIKEEPDSL